jgi:predicted TPR repeat methyltransferase
MDALTLPDVSQWYTPDRISAEEDIWLAGEHYRENARRITDICHAQNLRTVLEFGCGIGLIPSVLPPEIEYVGGIDANYYMIQRAEARNPTISFAHADIRKTDGRVQVDLVCSFAVLKHFSLVEWPTILSKILAHGRFALFNQHALPDTREPFDAGKDWHSAWPRRCDILAAISAAGHEVIDWDDSHVDSGVGAPEAYITTRRIA